MKIYFYNDEWHIATNGTIDATDATTHDDKTSFKDLFFDVIPVEQFKRVTDCFEKDCTYLFELTHPMNRIVVDYKGKKQLTLLGIRNHITLADYKIEDEVFFLYPKIRLPKQYAIEITDLSELSVLADEINESGADFEGFIVRETDEDLVTGRVKIKSPKYLILHRLADRGSNSIAEILLEHEEEEFEAYIDLMPDHIKEEYYIVKEKFVQMIVDLEVWFKEYKELSEKVERKELALAILSGDAKRYSGLIFTHIDRGGSPLELLRNNLNPVKKLRNLLGIYTQ